MADTPDPTLLEARRERALRWAAADLRGYPALGADQETKDTLAAAPPVEPTKKAKGPAPQE